MEARAQLRQARRSERQLFQQLPCIEKGINLIESDPGVEAFKILLAREISNGRAVWIDQGDRASSFDMAGIAGSRVLSRIEVSRSYTPYQHYRSVMDAEELLGSDVELMVLPSINLMYEDQLRETELRDLFVEVLERLREYVEDYGLKLMTSLSPRVPGEVEPELRSAIDRRIEVESLEQGLRFSSAGFESRIYRSGDKIQTTIPVFTGEVNFDGENQQNLQAAPGAVL